MVSVTSETLVGIRHSGISVLGSRDALRKLLKGILNSIEVSISEVLLSHDSMKTSHCRHFTMQFSEPGQSSCSIFQAS